MTRTRHPCASQFSSRTRWCGLAPVVRVTFRTDRRHATRRALLVDRIGVLVAVLAWHAQLPGRTELGCVAVAVAVTFGRCAGSRDAVSGASASDAVLARVTELATYALVEGFRPPDGRVEIVDL